MTLKGADDCCNKVVPIYIISAKHYTNTYLRSGIVLTEM